MEGKKAEGHKSLLCLSWPFGWFAVQIAHSLTSLPPIRHHLHDVHYVDVSISVQIVPGMLPNVHGRHPPPAGYLHDVCYIHFAITVEVANEACGVSIDFILKTVNPSQDISFTFSSSHVSICRELWDILYGDKGSICTTLRFEMDGAKLAKTSRYWLGADIDGSPKVDLSQGRIDVVCWVGRVHLPWAMASSFLNLDSFFCGILILDFQYAWII